MDEILSTALKCPVCTILGSPSFTEAGLRVCSFLGHCQIGRLESRQLAWSKTLNALLLSILNRTVQGEED